MDKSPQAFRTISEVAETLDVPAHVLRFWESKFPAIKPVKRGGGRRYYRPDDVTLLVGIRELLYEDGLTIKGVQKIFRERGARHVSARGAGEAGGAAAVEAPLGLAPDPAAVNGDAAVAPDAVRGAFSGAVPGGAAPTPGAPPAAAAETADSARVSDAIARLEALRARLRRGDGDPAAKG